ncbi:MAG: M14 family metallopeptidase [Planctomycetota bacterium]
MTPILILALAACQGPRGTATQAGMEQPPTVAEESGFTRTSTTAEVQAFLRSLERLPQAHRLSLGVLGRTTQGREIPLVRVRLEGFGDGVTPAADRLRVVVQANIHGGEVEGKEACQILLREVAHGGHEDLLDRLELWVVPDFNADGNDAMSDRNRVDQNGPDVVGTRHNGAGLDLNRDWVKVESPEVRAMLGLLNEVDPHLFVDLHTTDGSAHGYHLTYAPSLAVNCDDGLAAFEHQTLLPALREDMAARGFRVFDYGNFEGEGVARVWKSFSQDPRFATNYAGMRNRLSVLSEAYSHLPFEERVAVTKAFVLANLHALLRFEDEVRRLCAAADARAGSAEPQAFGSDSRFCAPVAREVLVGRFIEVELPDGRGKRLVAHEDHEAVRMGVQVAFEPTRRTDLPGAWLVPHPPEGLADHLRLHGLTVDVLAEPVDMGRGELVEFVVTSVERAERPFEGHRLVKVEGEFLAGRAPAPGRHAGRARPPAPRPARGPAPVAAERGLARDLGLLRPGPGRAPIPGVAQPRDGRRPLSGLRPGRAARTTGRAGGRARGGPRPRPCGRCRRAASRGARGPRGSGASPAGWRSCPGGRRTGPGGSPSRRP